MKHGSCFRALHALGLAAVVASVVLLVCYHLGWWLVGRLWPR